MKYLKLFENFQSNFPDVFNKTLIRGSRVDKDEFIDDPSQRTIHLGDAAHNKDYRKFMTSFTNYGIPDPTKSVHMFFRPKSKENDKYGSAFEIMPQEGAKFGFTKKITGGGLGQLFFKNWDELPIVEYQQQLIDSGMVGYLSYEELIKMSKEEGDTLHVWTESPCLHKKIKKETKAYKSEPLLKDRVKEIVKAAKDFGCSIRIGVNGGSIEQDLLEKYKEPCPEALVESAERNIKILEDLDFFNFKISVKASDIFLAVNAYRQLSKKCDYPLHLGITEAGSYFAGTIKSSIGIGMLLSEGIGDTIRISLSSDPVNEVKAGLEILKSLNLKNRGVKIISCPSCARQAFEVIKTVEILEQRLSHIKEPLTLSIIGCVVNGPGEASQTDIGLTGGGKGSNMIYLSGLADHKVPSEKIIDHIVGLVEKKSRADQIFKLKNS